MRTLLKPGNNGSSSFLHALLLLEDLQYSVICPFMNNESSSFLHALLLLEDLQYSVICPFMNNESSSFLHALLFVGRSPVSRHLSFYEQ
jgi:hypothetical protein